MRLALLLLAASLALAGCESLGGPERLVADLRVQGFRAAIGTHYDDALLGGQGTTVCVGNDTVSVLEFPDVNSTIEAAAKIDRNDPSHVGNGIVEWVGSPRFWLRDRAIVLYVGDDAGVDLALRNILGPPFAEGPGWGGRGGPGGPQRPPCERAD